MWGYVLNQEHTGRVLGQGQFGLDVTTSPSYPRSAIARRRPPVRDARPRRCSPTGGSTCSPRRASLVGLGVAVWAWRRRRAAGARRRLARRGAAARAAPRPARRVARRLGLTAVGASSPRARTGTSGRRTGRRARTTRPSGRSAPSRSSESRLLTIWDFAAPAGRPQAARAGARFPGLLRARLALPRVQHLRDALPARPGRAHRAALRPALPRARRDRLLPRRGVDRRRPRDRPRPDEEPCRRPGRRRGTGRRSGRSRRSACPHVAQAAAGLERLVPPHACVGADPRVRTSRRTCSPGRTSGGRWSTSRSNDPLVRDGAARGPVLRRDLERREPVRARAVPGTRAGSSACSGSTGSSPPVRRDDGRVLSAS